MAKSRKERIETVMAGLNALEVGELSAIDNKLVVATQEVAGLEELELEGVLQAARTALGRGDVPNFRRLVAQTVSRLGHLR